MCVRGNFGMSLLRVKTPASKNTLVIPNAGEEFHRFVRLHRLEILALLGMTTALSGAVVFQQADNAIASEVRHPARR